MNKTISMKMSYLRMTSLCSSFNLKHWVMMLTLGIAISAAEGNLFAQRGGPGGPGGPGGGRGGRDSNGFVSILTRDTYASEFQLSDDQKKQLDDLRNKYQPDREAMAPLFEKMRSENEADRNAAMAEMRKMTEATTLQLEQEAEKILDKKVVSRARELYIQSSGPRVLMRSDYASQYKLTDDQKAQLTKLNSEMDAARMQMGFRSTDEEREKFNQEWNAKFLQVLDPEQKANFEKSQGVIFNTSTATTPTAPANTAGSTPTAPATNAPPVRQFVELPRDPNKKEVASFDVDPKPMTIAMNQEAPAKPYVENEKSDAKEATPAVDPAAPKNPAEQLISFNFSYAPWQDVLKQYADRNKLTLNLLDTPQGTFNYYDRKQYTPAQALDIMNGYLLTRGYCLVRKDEFLICLNVDNGIPPNLIPTVTMEDLPKHGRNEIVAVVFPVGTLDVNVLAAEVTQLVGPQGKVIPLKGAASIMVQDIAQNLNRISEMVLRMTSNANPEAVTFRSFKLKHIRAAQAESILKSLAGQSSGITNVSASNERRNYDRDRERERSGQSSSQPQSTAAASLAGMVMTVEPRTNSLLITATAAQFVLIDETLKTIDVSDSEISPIAQLDDTTPELRVYQVYESDAREVAKTLEVIMPGVVVNEDGQKGKVHIFTTAYKHREVEALIRKLDGQATSNNAAVIPLFTLDPVSTTITLRSMFVNDGNKAPVIEADSFGRRIIVRGSENQVAEVKSILNQLGETGELNNSSNNYSSGPIRSISLGGRDPEQLLPLIEQVWGKSSGSKIRVVKPSERGSNLINSPSSNKSSEKPESTDEKKEEPARTSRDKGRDELEREHLTNNEETYKVSLIEESGSDLTITVIGGELVITGGTDDDRNKLEELIRSLAQTMPVQNSWTVFYLRSADATTTAEMLEQLIPSSVVSTTSASNTSMLSSMTSGLSSMGSSLMDMSGLSSLGGSTTLTIIPEVRLNALFVSGPAYLVRDVESLLEILDSAERPESLRDRQPRMVPVEHADVNEVYKIVNDVYKDLLQPNPLAALAKAGGGGGGGNNPLAMLMGQGGRGGAMGAADTKLTLGVDERTSHIIVSADDTLYKEIEALVQKIDKAALEAKRTIRVINLQHADPTLVKSTLGTLVPRVKVTTSGSPRTSSSSSSSQTPAAPNVSGSDNNQDAVRQIMEQRFREAMEQQRGSSQSAPSGRSSSGNSGFSPFGGGSRGPSGGSSGGSSRGSSGRGR